MYLDYLGLRENPFSVTSDPAFLFLSRKHREALSHMIYGIRERKGFIAVTGDVGTGKTTLCKALLRHVDPRTKTALLLHSSLSELQLIQSVIQDFGLNPVTGNRLSLLNQLNQFLLEQMQIGNNVVLIIDEAQNLNLRLLEQVRLLSNFETDKQKLVQIILVGQPQLKHKLALPQMEQLRQRIAVRYHIEPLDRDELETYIQHRLQMAGSDGRVHWSPDAVDEVFGFSHGVPRLVNLICDRSLLACFVGQTLRVEAGMVRRSAQELAGEVSSSQAGGSEAGGANPTPQSFGEPLNARSIA